VRDLVSELSDRDLVERICTDDPEAAEELLLRRCGRAIAWLSRQYSYEDLLGHLYLHLREGNWRRLRTWRGDSPIVRWVEQVAVRICRRKVKDSRRFVSLEDGGYGLLEEPGWRPDEQWLRTVERVRLLEAIEQLDAQRDRLVLLAAYFEGKDPDDIAAELGITRGNVDVIKHRALKRLRRMLEDGDVGS
jgi:RNA polymerase sigma factor (sigma-70 family)